MRLLILFVLLVIAYLIFKAVTGKKAPTGNPDAPSNSPTDASADSAADVVHSQSESASAGSALPASANLSWLDGLDTGNTIADIAEMFKMLNLRESDAPRLAISSDEYAKLKSGDAESIDGSKLEETARRLRDMLA